MASTAVLFDGEFFLRRYRACYGRNHTPETTAKNLFSMAIRHLDERDSLYRIFFYDCPPLAKKAHNPITGNAIDFSKTDVYAFRTQLHRRLIQLRKVALRLGRVAESRGGWSLTPDASKRLLNGTVAVTELTDRDLSYAMTQKGVDMRLGLDIASLAHKRLVQKLVLIAGDADFVPAAKHARREGIDVVLDPMWQTVADDLYEHIDGLKSVCKDPRRA